MPLVVNSHVPHPFTVPPIFLYARYALYILQALRDLSNMEQVG